MKIGAFAAGALAVLLAAAPLLSQKAGSQPQQSQPSQQNQPSSTTSQAATSPAPQGKVPRGSNEQGCWKQADIPNSVMDKRKDIQANAKAEIEAICKNSSLTAQQKKEQIHKIHVTTQDQVSALLSPQQQDALAKCQHGRGKGGAHPASGVTGPCGTTE